MLMSRTHKSNFINYKKKINLFENIHKKLIETRNNGKGILLISTELDEILTLSDRILVLFEGKIIKEFSSNASTEEIGLAMAGQS